VFETTARQESFTKAAEELNITQPTVSSQIKQLTRAIGLPLFEHIGKSLYLTETGKALLVTCQDIFEKLDNFEMKVADLKGAKEGKLRISAITTTKYFLPRILGLFCQKYPDIDVSLEIINHDNLINKMLENEDDLYILSQLPEDIDLHSQAFLDNPLVVVAKSDHPLAGQKNIPIFRLNNEPFIMREFGSGTRNAVENLFAENNVNVKVRLELGSNEAIKEAIAGGLGMSVLSRHTLQGYLNNGELTILNVQNFPIERHWYISYLSGKQLSVIAQAFLGFLIEKSQLITQNNGKKPTAIY
jgi:DNA-binding transcriptional LysR family regulator